MCDTAYKWSPSLDIHTLIYLNKYNTSLNTRLFATFPSNRGIVTFVKNINVSVQQKQHTFFFHKEKLATDPANDKCVAMLC